MTNDILTQYDLLIHTTDVLTEETENEFFNFVSFQEKCRKKWFAAEKKYQELEAAMLASEAEQERLKVQLKMARHQLDVEMSRRLKLEKSVDHMSRQLVLIRDLLKGQDTDKKILVDSMDRYARTTRHSDVSFYVSYTDEDSSIVLPNSLYDESSKRLNSNTSENKYGQCSVATNHVGTILQATEVDENGNYLIAIDDDNTFVADSNQENTQNKNNGDYLINENPKEIIVIVPSGDKKNNINRAHLNADDGLKTMQSRREQWTSNNVLMVKNGEGVVTPIPSTEYEYDPTKIDQMTFNINNDHRKKHSTPKDEVTINMNSGAEFKLEVDEIALTTPISNYIHSKPLKETLLHNFVSKVAVKLEMCGPCKKRIRFGSNLFKCKQCKAICHAKCMDQVVVPCNPLSKPTGKRDGSIGCYVNNKKSPQVPDLVIQCIEEIEKRGLNERGLYTVPGPTKEIKELKEDFLRKKNPDLNKILNTSILCGCLKEFLKGLSEPLITFSMFESFVMAVALSESDGNMSPIYQCVSELPQVNRETLAAIIVHLQRIIGRAENNNNIINLSKIFGPTLVGHRSANPSPIEMLEDTQCQPTIVRRLLEMPMDYWKEFLGISPTIIPNRHTTPIQASSPTITKTPETSESTDVPTSLGSIGPDNLGRRPKRKAFNAMKPNGLSRDGVRGRHFFDSPCKS